MGSIRTQDLYKAVVTEVSGIASSGDVNFTVSTPPSRTNGFLVLSPDNALNRETVYFHNVIGSRIYVRGVNRKSPKAHSLNDLIQMNDVEDIFNYYADMTSPLFYVEKTGALNVLVWGGTVLVNRTQVTVADTNLTLTDNTTNYIVYDYLTNVISVNTTGVGLVKATVVTASGIITSITYNVIKESYADPYVPDLALVAPAVQNQQWVYAAATGAVNTYAITLTPAPTAYAVGQKFTFKANLANTGTATLNVNGLGAKTIKKLGGTTNLESGDIAINHMVEVEYNGTDFDMQSPVANVFTLTNLIQTFTAGETIAAGSAVYMNTDGKIYLASTSTINFIGFAQGSAILNGSISVYLNGVSTSQSGLTTGSKYYLTDGIAFGNTWSSKTAMTTARYTHTASSVSSKIYCIGGTSNGSNYLQTNEEYNPSLNTWSSKANMTTGRQSLSSSVVSNKIYCIGGTTGSVVAINEEYDPSLNTWSSKTSMTAARYALTTSVVSNKIYAIGGNNGAAYVGTNEEYDPSLNTWATKTSMTSIRRELASGAVNNKIYCIGGENGSPLATNEEYNPSLNTWATKTSMTTARPSLTASVVNSKIYCIGGLNGGQLTTNEEYDPSLNTWASKSGMTTARYQHAASVVSNKIYCIGGRAPGVSAINEEYTPNGFTPDGTISTTSNSTKVGVATSATSLLIQTNF